MPCIATHYETRLSQNFYEMQRWACLTFCSVACCLLGFFVFFLIYNVALGWVVWFSRPIFRILGLDIDTFAPVSNHRSHDLGA